MSNVVLSMTIAIICAVALPFQIMTENYFGAACGVVSMILSGVAVRMFVNKK